MGFVKINVSCRNTLYGYLYLDSGYGKPIELDEVPLVRGDARYLASLLYLEADRKFLYDASVKSIDFDRELAQNELWRTP